MRSMQPAWRITKVRAAWKRDNEGEGEQLPSHKEFGDVQPMTCSCLRDPHRWSPCVCVSGRALRSGCSFAGCFGQYQGIAQELPSSCHAKDGGGT